MLKVTQLQQSIGKKEEIKRCYLVEVIEDGSSWFVTKRYKQFRELKRHIDRTYRYVLPKFPNRCVFNSYTEDTLKKRTSQIQSFIDALVSKNPNILKDSFVHNFVRTDLYLESYEDVQIADTIKNSLNSSKDLDSRLNQLIQEGVDIKREITDLLEDYTNIEKCLTTLKTKTTQNVQTLETNVSTKKTDQRARNECIRCIQVMNSEFKELRQRMSLVRVNETHNRNKLDIYQEKSGKLKGELELLNQYIEKVNCRFLNNNWHIEEYRVIISTFNDKINLLTKEIMNWQNTDPPFFTTT
jgi:chromosome segregation ATPase